MPPPGLSSMEGEAWVKLQGGDAAWKVASSKAPPPPPERRSLASAREPGPQLEPGPGAGGGDGRDDNSEVCSTCSSQSDEEEAAAGIVSPRAAAVAAAQRAEAVAGEQRRMHGTPPKDPPDPLYQIFQNYDSGARGHLSSADVKRLLIAMEYEVRASPMRRGNNRVIDRIARTASMALRADHARDR